MFSGIPVKFCVNYGHSVRFDVYARGLGQGKSGFNAEAQRTQRKRREDREKGQKARPGVMWWTGDTWYI